MADRREHVTVTRRGRPAAVLIPVAEYEALEETAEILSDDATLEAIRRGLEDLRSEDLVPLIEVRQEHVARTPPGVVAKVFLARSASEALARLDYRLAEAIIDALSELQHDPDVGYVLRGWLNGLFSYRVGAYRIIYEQRDASTVRVVAIRHRSQAYSTDLR